MTKICEYCGQEFEGRSDSRFCCSKCRSAYHNKQKKRLGEMNDCGDLDGDYDSEETSINTSLKALNALNEYDDDETDDDEDVYEEDESEEEEDDTDEDDDEPDYKELEYELSNSRWRCDDLQKRNAQLVNELGEEKRKCERLRDKLTRQTDRNTRLEQRIKDLENELERADRQRQRDKEIYNSIAQRPKKSKEPEQEEIKDDFLSLIEC